MNQVHLYTSRWGSLWALYDLFLIQMISCLRNAYRRGLLLCFVTCTNLSWTSIQRLFIFYHLSYHLFYQFHFRLVSLHLQMAHQHEISYPSLYMFHQDCDCFELPLCLQDYFIMDFFDFSFLNPLSYCCSQFIKLQIQLFPCFIQTPHVTLWY